MQDFMKGRKRWLGVLIWAAFIIFLILRIGTGSYLAEIDAQHWEATRPKAETTLTEEEIAALEQEVYNQEAVASILSLVVLGFGLAGLYFVNRDIAQRLAFALGTVFIVTLVTFVILRAMPGDPFHQRATELVQQRQMDYDDALRVAYREFDYDPDKPFLEGFLEYVGKVLRFDLGLSWQYKIPVNDVITEALPWTLLVLASSLAIGFTVGSVLGMIIVEAPDRP
jgi:ABC-type dipeptide/oligopeptide/nickel transport system permease component